MKTIDRMGRGALAALLTLALVVLLLGCEPVAARGDRVVVNVFVEPERPRSSGFCDQRCREDAKARARASVASWTPQDALDRKIQRQMQEKLHWQAAEHTQ